MGFIQSLKEFLMKEKFDFEAPDIDLYSFHPQIRIFIAPMGIFFNNKNSLLRLLWPGVCVSLTIVALTLETIFVLHGIQIEDYSFATECFCYFVMLGVLPSVLIGMLLNRDNVIAILDKMNNDFLYICSLTTKHRADFLKGQLLIWKLCYAWLIFTSVVAAMFATLTIAPLIYLSLFGTQDEHTVRPLMFPMWLPKDDPYRTPNYEMFMLLELSFLFIYDQVFAVYVYIQFHVLMHNNKLLDMIILDLETIFEGLDESVVYLPRNDLRRVAVQKTLNKRMKRIVTWHDSVYKCIEILSSVQGPPLMYQVMFSSVAMCLMLYQVAVKLDQGTFDILFAVLCCATCMQLWIPCYLGTMLRNKAFAVGDACWNCGWHETPLGRMLRMDIIIVILRSQRPLSIKFIGLPHLSLETFSSVFHKTHILIIFWTILMCFLLLQVMSTAYSYFNMLRQYN